MKKNFLTCSVRIQVQKSHMIPHLEKSWSILQEKNPLWKQMETLAGKATLTFSFFSEGVQLFKKEFAPHIL